jgi:hypothetical protein
MCVDQIYREFRESRKIQKNLREICVNKQISFAFGYRWKNIKYKHKYKNSISIVVQLLF